MLVEEGMLSKLRNEPKTVAYALVRAASRLVSMLALDAKLRNEPKPAGKQAAGINARPTITSGAK
jgi:hypothetical protein